ncbi:MAG: hypothetical protein ABSH41_10230, partial [Syntrophobacteraceae bacterium]
PLAHPCLLSFWNLLQCILEQFNETLYRQSPLFCLTAGLLRYDSKNTVLPIRFCKRRETSSFCSGERLGEFYTSNHKVIRELTLLTLLTI